MMNATPNAPQKKEAGTNKNSQQERVLQPQKLADIAQSPALAEFSELITLMGTISERVVQHHEQFAGTQQAQDDTGQGAGPTTREQLLAHLPQTHVMQKKLESHIAKEIRQLKKQARAVAASRKAGWAYELTLLLARIRRLTGIARSLLSASLEALKKFYILVFIDKQSLEAKS